MNENFVNFIMPLVVVILLIFVIAQRDARINSLQAENAILKQELQGKVKGE